MKIRKAILAMGIAGVIGVTGCAAESREATHKPISLPEQPMDCSEGQPCWDCGSMGNMVCGTWELAKASADRCGGTVYFHQERMFTTVCPV
jgi:hypothetical protein